MLSKETEKESIETQNLQEKMKKDLQLVVENEKEVFGMKDHWYSKTHGFIFVVDLTVVNALNFVHFWFYCSGRAFAKVGRGHGNIAYEGYEGAEIQNQEVHIRKQER